MLERARWALDEKELETLKERAEYYGLDKSKNFEEFKEKYLNILETLYNEDVPKQDALSSVKRSNHANERIIE